MAERLAILRLMESERQRILRLRAEALHLIRRFFRGLGYLEVDTPLLAPYLIPEASLEVFRTLGARAGGEPSELYLIPSPELWLKRLLAEGCGSLFQLGRCFRNHEPASPLHEPEFTMLEWYTVGADYLQSMTVVERLFAYLLERLELGPVLCFRGRELNCRGPFRRLSMAQAFRDSLALELGELTALEDLRERARSLGVLVGDADSWADLFHKLFLGFVEPRLPADRPLLLSDFPAGVPTLARRKPGTPWAERWELYLAGIELANCYTEATDPQQVADFFRSQSQAKAEALEPHRVDGELERILSERLPPCSGAALGVDRLLMILLERDSVSEVNAFALS
jgi:lysyl-tRNA synthetase class 2